MTRPEMAALVRRMRRMIRRRLRRRRMKLRSIPNARFVTIGVITSAVGTAIIMLFVLASDVITATESALLINAARKGSRAQLKTALFLGADINSKDKGGITSLHNTAMLGDTSLTAVLLNYGADMEDRNNALGWTPLLFAEANGQMAMVEQLVRLGADVNVKGVLGLPPLFYAARYGHLEMAKWLVSKGAEMNATTRDGRGLLHEAVSQAQARAIPILIAAGADVNARDAKGWTPLRNALRKSDRRIAELLMAGGAK